MVGGNSLIARKSAFKKKINYFDRYGFCMIFVLEFFEGKYAIFGRVLDLR